MQKIILLTISIIFTLSCKKKIDTPDPITPPVVVVPVVTPFEVPNISDIVMYEINERAFSTSGNFAGILPRLDSIKALGVNVIWLMPIHPIGIIKTVNSPYCIKDFEAVSPEYGTLEEFKNLVAEAHKRKIAVILDWVANHTAWDNPWIARKDWYSQDANGNIIRPAGTNWQDVADLNFDNQEMRLEMIKSMKYWIKTANIDGYRCDAANYVPFSFWKQAIDTLRNIPNRKVIMLAEGARADHFEAGFQINFGWDFFGKNKTIFNSTQSAYGYNQTHLNEYAKIPSGSHKLRFTSNHDECAWDNTPLALFGGLEGSLSAFVVSAFMGGIPLIYNGQEVGCPKKLPFFSRSPIDWTTNPDMLKTYKTLMAIRAAHPALRTGNLVAYPNVDICVFKRSIGTDEVLVLANTKESQSVWGVPNILQKTAWKNAVTGKIVNLETDITLGNYEYLILTK